jgi:hypothetical protein
MINDMKPSFSKLFAAGLMLGLTVMFSFGANVNYNFPATSTSTNKNLLVGAGNITQITVSATSNAVATVFLFDSPSAFLTNMSAKYTNYVPTVYTNMATYTDILGNTVSNTYFYITNLASPQGGSNGFTNAYRRIATFVVPASSTIVVPYTTANPFIQGLLFTNDSAGPASISIDYQPWK